jgi:hypothetical protein
MRRFNFTIPLDVNVSVTAATAEKARAVLFRMLEDTLLDCTVAEGDETGDGAVEITGAGTINGEEPTLVSTNPR